MHNEYQGIIRKVKSSNYLKEIEKIPNKNKINNNSIDNIKTNKEINLKKKFNKNNLSDLYNNKNKNKTNKAKTPKTPLLNSKQNSLNRINKKPLSTIQYNDNEIEKYLNKNGFKLKNIHPEDNKKNKKSIKSYISALFDYNIKNNHNNNICINLKNRNSKPIKIINDGYKNLYTNKNKIKENHICNSSLERRTSSIYEDNSNKDKILKNNYINSKKEKNKNRKKINSIKNKTNKKYLSFTPDCSRKAAFIKKKNSSKILNDENKRKEEIKKFFEKELKNRFNHGLKTNKNKNSKGLSINSSRNRIDDVKSTNYSNSQSQKNIARFENYSNDIYNPNISEKKEFNTINNEKKIISKTKNNYKKYYSLLEQKIKKLNEEIEEIRDEEKSLILQLINYKEKESECKYIRNLREEIKKYKTVIEKTSNVYEEYSLEILKIKKIIGENEIDNKLLDK